MKNKENEEVILNAFETMLMFVNPKDLRWSLTYVVLRYITDNRDTFEVKHVNTLSHLIFFLEDIHEATEQT